MASVFRTSVFSLFFFFTLCLLSQSASACEGAAFAATEESVCGKTQQPSLDMHSTRISPAKLSHALNEHDRTAPGNLVQSCRHGTPCNGPEYFSARAYVDLQPSTGLPARGSLPAIQLAQASPFNQDFLQTIEQLRRDFEKEAGREQMDEPLGRIEMQAGVPRLTCWVIGSLLGFGEHVELFDLTMPLGRKEVLRVTSPITGISGDEGWEKLYAARFAAYFLDKLRFYIDLYSGMPPVKLGALWNLDCAGQREIPNVYAQEAEKEEFEISDTGRELLVLGPITPGFYHRFISQLAKNPEIATIRLGSGGGSVLDALRVGKTIRQLGLDTSLYASCYSACPLIFVAGTERVVWFPGLEKLGFHQISANGKAIERTHQLYSEIKNYADEMGADGSYLVSLMHQAAPNYMHYPDHFDLCKAWIITFARNLCIGGGF